MRGNESRSSGTVLLALGVAFLLIPASSRTNAQRHPDPSRFLRWTFQDPGSIVRTDPVLAATRALTYGALLVRMNSWDSEVNDLVTERGGYSSPLFLRRVNVLGESELIPVAAGLFGVTLLGRNERLQDAAFTSLQSAAYSRLVIGLMKTMVGRARPYSGKGEGTFRPFAGAHRSFPSGHTTTAFALVTPWVFYYPGPPTYALLALAPCTGAARIILNKHWLTDVLAGAFLGFGMGATLSRLHREEGPRFSVVPAFSSEPARLSLRLRL